MAVRVKSISWLGTRTHRFREMSRLYREVLGLTLVTEEAGFQAFKLPSGDLVELFSEDSPFNPHFGTAPVAGFAVEDIEAARVEMEAAGIEFIGPIEGGETSRWSHFRAPDGNLYELTERH